MLAVIPTSNQGSAVAIFIGKKDQSGAVEALDPGIGGGLHDELRDTDQRLPCISPVSSTR